MPGMVARDPESDLGVGAKSVLDNGAAAPPAQPVQGARPVALGIGNDAFDSWLQAELSRLYGAALAEPLPEDMIRLLNEAARRR